MATFDLVTQETERVGQGGVLRFRVRAEIVRVQLHSLQFSDQLFGHCLGMPGWRQEQNVVHVALVPYPWPAIERQVDLLQCDLSEQV
ncbi:hypothetical protein D3C80_1700800 [compost metagenome]